MHWGGGLRTPKSIFLAGYPCCCSGQRAIKIAEVGAITSDPNKVTCKKCAKMVSRYIIKKKRGNDADLRSDPA